MSGDASSARDPVDLLIERFLELHRAGEPVTPEGYAEQHPAHAGQLMELLPTLLQLEEMKRDRASTGAGPARVALPSIGWETFASSESSAAGGWAWSLRRFRSH